MPGLKLILPAAPIQPVTLNGGMRMPSWHDIRSLHNVDREDFRGLAESRAAIEDLLRAEIASGTASNRIVLGGFSQGSAVSLYTGLQFDQPLAGIVGLSGYLPHTSGNFASLVHSANRATPVFMAHGDIDQVVRLEIGQRSAAELKKALGNEQVTFNVYEDLGHFSNEQELKDLAAFLKKVLP